MKEKVDDWVTTNLQRIGPWSENFQWPTGSVDFFDNWTFKRLLLVIGDPRSGHVQ